MAVTKKSFQGGPPCEWIGDGFHPGSNTQDLLTSTTGAVAMQSSASKGRHRGMRGPGHDADDPRRAWSTHIGNQQLTTVPSGSELDPNRASTGVHQPVKRLITGQKAPQTTGSGEGKEHVHSYAPVAQGASSRANRQPRRPDRLLGVRNQGG
jgi:hypothetical protein